MHVLPHFFVLAYCEKIITDRPLTQVFTEKLENLNVIKKEVTGGTLKNMLISKGCNLEQCTRKGFITVNLVYLF